MVSSAKSEAIAPPSGGTKYNTLSAELDESFYNVDDEETEFLMQQTGIRAPDELKKHVVDVQREVYAVSIENASRAYIGLTGLIIYRFILIRVSGVFDL